MSRGEKRDVGESEVGARFRNSVLAIAVGLSAAALLLRFGTAPELPEMPPEPAGALERAQAVAQRMGVSDRAYRERIARDADRFGVSTSPEAMGRVFEYARAAPDVILDPRAPGGARGRNGGAPDGGAPEGRAPEGKTPEGGASSVQVAGLSLRAEIEENPGRRRDQIVLAIENRRDRPIAYRVATSPTDGTSVCESARPLRHNAVAIAPGGAARRSECPYRSDRKLAIEAVETLELPALGYYYLSRLDPEHLDLSERARAGHEPPAGEICEPLVSARVERALDRGALSWRDAADFYARHDCRAFSIPANYRAFEEDGHAELPAARPRR